MKQIKLIVEGGRLYTAHADIVDKLMKDYYKDNVILIKQYDAGDYDTIKFPKPNEENLRSALYDARETGVIPGDTTEVELPDGTIFQID